MRKSKNRETIHMGMPTKRSDAIAVQLRSYPREVVHGPPVGIPLESNEERRRFAELLEAETEAANAHADEIDARPALYTGSADPGSIVGLDGFTPTVDTPVNGDTERTDPDPS